MNDKYNGNSDATFRGGQSVAQLDPTIMISAMAAVTKSVSFAITGNTTYIPVGSSVDFIVQFSFLLNFSSHIYLHEHGAH